MLAYNDMKDKFLEGIDDVFDSEGRLIDKNLLKPLSNDGNFYKVYKYKDSVIKLNRGFGFNTLSRLTIKYLKKIRTKRILLPTSEILNSNYDIMGYKMELVKGEKEIQNEKMGHILDEMRILKNDIDVLNLYHVFFNDITSKNKIYNGKVFFVDPGNFYSYRVSLFMDEEQEVSEKHLNESLCDWNYDGLNKLYDILVFDSCSPKDQLSFQEQQMINDFFASERKSESNLDVFENFFDSDLTVKEAREKFLKDYAK